MFMEYSNEYILTPGLCCWEGYAETFAEDVKGRLSRLGVFCCLGLDINVTSRRPGPGLGTPDL